MKFRSLLAASTLTGAAMLVTGGAPVPAAAPMSTERTPVIAMIDTGLNSAHQEFDYRGPTSDDDQIVAWFDFSADAGGHTPRPGQLWDDVNVTPFDPNGHGSSTASMAAGRNMSAEKTPSFNPGGKLAIAKVGSGEHGDEITGDLPAAIRWATDTVKADIINMSIGAIAPLPRALVSDVYGAVAHAREQGVLVVVSNGNGLLNAGLPDPGWATPYGNSLNVLSVGASGFDGASVTTDPEVTAQFTVVGATGTGSAPDSHQTISGTSFGAPLVAGFAAKVLEEARASGHPLDADGLEQLVKHSARDTAVPPIWEGYGVIDGEQMPVAIAAARTGTLPVTDSTNALYVDTLVMLLRNLWTTI